ncbi:MAG: aminotransferase class V-fold PLP-dependent enzyme, partial [Acidobacteriota bacterium]
WKAPLEAVRGQTAAYLGCAANEISFSHNTTEVFNLLAHGLPLGDGDEVLFSSLNHSGASVCWTHVGERRGYTVRRFEFPVQDAASMTEDDVVACHLDAIRPETRALALPHVDNILGLRHPLRKIAAGARRRGVEFIAVDAAQTVGMLPLDLPKLGVDAYATSAHKWLQGPKGLGVAYLRADLQARLLPMWMTWGQRTWSDSVRRFEDYGTRNLAEVLTLGDAITFQEELGTDRVQKHHRRLHAAAQARVDAEPRLTWHSPRDWDRGSAIYSVGVEGRPSSELFRELFENHGLVFRPFEVQGINAVRLSPNTLNTEAELTFVFDRLVEALG